MLSAYLHELYHLTETLRAQDTVLTLFYTEGSNGLDVSGTWTVQGSR